ncbi:hypothetical protein A2Z00_00060 [Candidatus Gottesmanbacteria bacterium RBG_13_45_10]|uniref:Glycosyltransferase 2-like domain-containing protein n=1 Tax=Candidatus Gottesmanbacteria bacterium RBG_13_45_10 TaxID=1798370 RepID=A0A1F5ZH91_9BACT|nr:MAG: hypothetical protein A2Z00_00060 [Candidatus Gottesmanbacteria bacterium RBG_13_45_10]
MKGKFGVTKQQAFSNIGVVIPALNESASLKILLGEITRLYRGITVVVVDDSGPIEQKKLEILQKKKFSGAKIHVIFRGKKGGRGSAVLEGMKWLLGDRHIAYMIEMDADLAHKPEEIRLFLEKKDRGDMIVGSRYLKQSHIIKWPLRRLIQSKLINFFLRLWLGLNLSDYTNGFRLYSRLAAEALVRAPLKEKGFIALSEIAYTLKQKGFTVFEVPTTFTDRRFGQSNADIKELMRSLVGAIRIRFS